MLFFSNGDKIAMLEKSHIFLGQAYIETGSKAPEIFSSMFAIANFISESKFAAANKEA